MTKKHFIALADALKESRPLESSFDMDNVHDASAYLDAKAQWDRDVRACVSVCIDANPRFQYQRFMAYIAGECGPNGGRR